MALKLEAALRALQAMAWNYIQAPTMAAATIRDRGAFPDMTPEESIVVETAALRRCVFPGSDDPAATFTKVMCALAQAGLEPASWKQA